MTPLLLLLCAAPVPAPVVPSTPAHMVGGWAYSWGQQLDGKVVFQADGLYVSRHHGRAAEGFTHTGWWEWDGKTLVLWEVPYGPGWQSCSPTRYEVDFGSPRGYHLTGKTPQGTAVVLSKIPPDTER